MNDDDIVRKALEILVKRLTNNNQTFFNANDASQFCILALSEKKSEVFSVLFLTSQNQLIEYVEMFQGGIMSCSVHIREVVRKALELNAANLIATHNHPSDKALPSSADLKLTDDLAKALTLFEIRLVDHIIVGVGDGYSMADHGDI